MKDFIVIVITVVLVFVGGIIAKKYFEKSGNEIVEIIEEMSKGLEIDTEEHKQNMIEKLKKEWDKKQSIWITIQYHTNINEMEDIVIECCNYYKTSNREEFDISCEKLKRNIEDLKYREEITLVNIL
jgi:hypothetical protein